MSLKSKSTSLSSPKPTTAQLASLAAALSKDTRTEGTESLARSALQIWEAAHELLTNPPPPPAPAEPAVPQPKHYPVTLDQFLRLMLPRLTGRTGERYALFREYLRFRLRHPLPPAQKWAWDNVPDNPIPFDSCNPRIVPGIDEPYSAEGSAKPETVVPTVEDVVNRFALWQSNPIPDLQSFRYHSKAFRDWYQKHHADEVSAKRRAAGLKGHASNSSNPDKRKGARPRIN
jgi:hypothetical protein